MDIGITMPTHGLLIRDDANFYIQRLEPENVRPFDFARLADRLGFHSLWFSDHVVMGANPDTYYPPNKSGRKAYPYRPTMFDAVVVMGGLNPRRFTGELTDSWFRLPTPINVNLLLPAARDPNEDLDLAPPNVRAEDY